MALACRSGNLVAQDFDHGGGATQIAFGPDSAGDRISDSWRLTWFGSAATNAASCALCDPDGDGMTNLQEYQAGTNPRDAGSALRILSFDNGNLLTWSSVSNRAYRVLATSDLGTNFVPISGAITASGSTASFLDLTTTNSQRFYRVNGVP